jgi:hypothetical protein
MEYNFEYLKIKMNQFDINIYFPKKILFAAENMKYYL